MEAILYQSKSMLFKDLTLAFNRMREVRDASPRGLAEIGFSAIVARHTGMRVTFVVERNILGASYNNAAAFSPVIDPNSPLFAFERRATAGAATRRISEYAITNYMESHEAMLKHNAQLQGCVDRARGRVSGAFSNAEAFVEVGMGLIGDKTITDAQLAAIVIHELGHVFTFFESLVHVVTTNGALQSAIGTLEQIPPDQTKLRIQLVYDTAKALDVKVENIEQLSKSGVKPEEFTAVFLTARLQPLHSATGSTIYDLRSSEFLADQFAVRHGAATELAAYWRRTVLSVAPTSLLGTKSFYALEAIKVAVALGAMTLVPMAALTFPMAAILALASTDAQAHAYDPPEQRIQRMRRDLIQAMRGTHVKVKDRAKILADIEVLDRLLESVHTHQSLFNKLWVWVTKTRRGQFNQTRMQQELEQLVNNDLYVQAEKLKQLTSF